MNALSTPLFQKGKADPQVPMPAVLGTVPDQPGPCPYLESPRTLSHSSSSPAACRLGHLATGTCPDCLHPVSERAVLRRGAGAAAAALHRHAGDGADPEVRLQRQVHIPGRLTGVAAHDTAEGRGPATSASRQMLLWNTSPSGYFTPGLLHPAPPDRSVVGGQLSSEEVSWPQLSRKDAEM